MEKCTKPEGYPYFQATFVTEQARWNAEEDREVPYYETHSGVLDFTKLDPLYWYRYRLMNTTKDKAEGTCIVLCCVDSFGNEHDLMFDDTLPKFDARIKQWIEYSNSLEDGTT